MINRNNECNIYPLTRINWRASLVPAAAVIPAPIAYIKVVAVKKLVVGVMWLVAWRLVYDNVMLLYILLVITTNEEVSKQYFLNLLWKNQSVQSRLKGNEKRML